MQRVWICLCSGKQFEDTFENQLWKNCNQCNFAFKGTFENPLWKITLGENRINVANATLHMFIPAVLGRIWKLIQDKRLEEP